MTPEQTALLAAIRTNPDDRTSRLVYADWLDEHDDPLAKYVRDEAELLALEPHTPEWAASARRLRDLAANSALTLGGWEFAADLDRIRTNIDRLRTLDQDRRVFGARWPDAGHEYLLNPPLAEAELFEFELRHGNTLPAEYRAFLLRVGNGRVGPGYGLATLDLAADLPRLRMSFGPAPADADSIAAAARAANETGNWSAIPPFRHAWSQRGYLRLAHNGCSNYSAIVVNGPRRGEMWNENFRFVPHHKKRPSHVVLNATVVRLARRGYTLNSTRLRARLLAHAPRKPVCPCRGSHRCCRSSSSEA
jgi:uncharacterized protein (TIGR02996 family)